MKRDPDEPEDSESAGAQKDASEDEDARLRALVRGAMKKSASAPPAASAEADAGAGDDGDDDGGDDGDGDGDGDEGDGPLIDEVDLKEALRGALQPPPGSVAPSLLRGVQKRLRVRSRGKFYGDGWSTAESPKTTYLVTSVLMLVLVALIFLILVPWSSTKLP